MDSKTLQILRRDAEDICRSAIEASVPDAAIQRALAAAEGLAGLEAVVASVGSDGTDGPTDAAGGITDGTTADALAALGISIDKTLAGNDAYHALKACGGLIVTGPTGTNVNDITVLLV